MIDSSPVPLSDELEQIRGRKDQAISAQLRPLIGTAQRVFSCPAPGGVFGCYKKPNPVCNHSAGMLDGLKPMAVHALLFKGSYHALHNTVLLGAVGRDEFLLQTVVAHQCRVASGAEHQAIVRTQQEGF